MAGDRVKFFSSVEVITYIVVFFAIGSLIGYSLGRKAFTRKLQE